MTKKTAAPKGFVADGWVADVLADIRRDVMLGHIPATVGGFADLHDHVDANVYLEEIPEWTPPDVHRLRNVVAELVDARIKDGVLRDLA